MSNYSTGNTERDALIVRAIQTATACNDPISVESLSAGHLPADFDLDTDELTGIMSNNIKYDAVVLDDPDRPLEAEQDAECGESTPQHGKPMIDTLPNGRPFVVSPEPLKKIEAPHAPENETPSQDTAQTAPEPEMPGGTYTITDRNTARVIPKVQEAEARRALDVANQRLQKARDNKTIAQGILRERRNDLGSAITQWQLLGNTLDNKTDAMSRNARQQQEIRNHLAGTQAERAARAGLRRPDTAKMFVQRHMTNGPSRGAYDRSAAARSGYVNRDIRRGAVPRLPSDR